jgi:hypothetical protein
MVLQTNFAQEANEMFSTKTRTTIVALVASLSFAATTVAPAVSQARSKTVSTKPSALREACNSLAGSMLNAEAEARNYEKKGDTKNAEAQWAAANMIFELYTNTGCVGAAITGPSASGIAAPVIGVSATR